MSAGDWIADDVLPDIAHLDGIPWFKAPLPRRWHRCRPQTGGWFDELTFIERCACGAARLDATGEWSRRNERRQR